MLSRSKAPFYFTIALTVAACGRAPRQTTVVHEDLLSAAPADAGVLLGGKLEPLRRAGFAALIERLEAADAFSLVSGWDEFVAAYDGQAPLIAARGRFDRAAIEGRLSAAGGFAKQRTGKALWESGDTALAFLNDQLIVVGRRDQAEAALSGKVGVSPLMRELISRLPEEADLWAVLAGGAALPDPPERSNLANAWKLVAHAQSVIAWANVSNGVRLQISATSVDEAAAAKLHDATRGLITLARFSAPRNQAWLWSVYDAVAVRRQAAEVRVEAYLDRATVNRVLALTGVE